MKTLFQRLLTESSPFFKKAQIVLVAVLVTINGLSAFIPATWLTDINIACIVGIVFSAATVKDGAIFENGFSLPALLQLLPQIQGQVAELKDAVAGKITVTQAVADATTTEPAKVATTVSVEAAPVIS